MSRGTFLRGSIFYTRDGMFFHRVDHNSTEVKWPAGQVPIRVNILAETALVVNFQYDISKTYKLTFGVQNISNISLINLHPSWSYIGQKASFSNLGIHLHRYARNSVHSWFMYTLILYQNEVRGHKLLHKRDNPLKFICLQNQQKVKNHRFWINTQH